MIIHIRASNILNTLF